MRVVNILWMFVLLLASCSQSEVINSEIGDNNKVSISVEMPSNIAATRAQIEIPATHRLRCIMEIWTSADVPSLKYRQEVAVDAGTLPTFNFELSRGDYNCLMWADFITKDAATTEVTTNGGVAYTHYEDTFYDTSSLLAVSVKDASGANLFDTDLCDGFFGSMEIKKTDATVNQTMKLKRPFAKLIVKENNAEMFATLKKVNASYEIPKSFNVRTGENGAAVMMVSCDKTFTEGDDSQILFTQYIFTPSAGLSLGNMALSFTTDAGKRSCDVKSESIMLTRNQQMLASGKLIESGTMSIDPTPDPTPTKDPNVGDYFFIDGTWSSSLTEENKDKCVGIVYASGALSGDEVSSYGAGSKAKIRGYVMALKNVGAYSELFPKDVSDRCILSNSRFYFYKQNADKNNKDDAATVFAKPVVSASWTQYNGYELTQTLLGDASFSNSSNSMNYPALYAFRQWTKDNTQPKNASAWYIPAAGQLLQAAGVLYGFTPNEIYKNNGATQTIGQVKAFSEAFQNAVNAGIAEHFLGGSNGKGYFVYTSTLNDNSLPMVIQLAENYIAPNASPNYRIVGPTRPFLTIIN